jgi:hypothetical protein
MDLEQLMEALSILSFAPGEGGAFPFQRRFGGGKGSNAHPTAKHTHRP